MHTIVRYIRLYQIFGSPLARTRYATEISRYHWESSWCAKNARPADSWTSTSRFELWVHVKIPCYDGQTHLSILQTEIQYPRIYAGSLPIHMNVVYRYWSFFSGISRLILVSLYCYIVMGHSQLWWSLINQLYSGFARRAFQQKFCLVGIGTTWRGLPEQAESNHTHRIKSDIGWFYYSRDQARARSDRSAILMTRTTRSSWHRHASRSGYFFTSDYGWDPRLEKYLRYSLVSLITHRVPHYTELLCVMPI